MEKAHRKRGGGGSQALSGSKAPDLEVLARQCEKRIAWVDPGGGIRIEFKLGLIDNLEQVSSE